jgi:excisionase family DNA binding protein
MAETVRSVLTTTQVAERLQVSDETVKNYYVNGDLEGFRLPGGHLRIFADSVAKILHPSTEIQS